jgi:hypothetical protein
MSKPRKKAVRGGKSIPSLKLTIRPPIPPEPLILPNSPPPTQVTQATPEPLTATTQSPPAPSPISSDDSVPAAILPIPEEFNRSLTPTNVVTLDTLSSPSQGSLGVAERNTKATGKRPSPSSPQDSDGEAPPKDAPAKKARKSQKHVEIPVVLRGVCWKFSKFYFPFLTSK